ncbi:MAG: Lrp/AsnC family transcriptional regulator [Pseudomonadales bacterium]
MKLDDLDTKLLELLKRDARKPITSLAQILGVTRLTVQKRLANLEQQQVIAGYTLRTGEAFNAVRFRAQALLNVEGGVGSALINYLHAIEEITSVYTVAGNVDVIVWIEAPDSDAIDSALARIREHPQVQHSQSCLLLSQKIDRKWY